MRFELPSEVMNGIFQVLFELIGLARELFVSLKLVLIGRNS